MARKNTNSATRRSWLQLTGGAAAAAGLAGLAGCVDDEPAAEDDEPADDDPDEDDPAVDDGIMGDYWMDLPEPETREGFLERANLAAHQEAPWIFLHQQQSVYGITDRIEWDARVDEAIEVDEMTPTADGNDIVITQGQLDTGLDPHDHRETTTDNIVIQAYDGLIERTPEGEIEPALATDWERIEPGHVRFHIREGVTFHNGDELQPSDVAYSINRIVDEDVDFASPQDDQLAGVVEAEVVEDEHAVDVFSDGLNPIVFQYFASYCDIVQQDWVEARSESELNNEMNGTGPFQLVDYTPDEEVVFEAFEDHWDGAPDADQVTFRAAEESSTRVSQLLEGETDVITNVPPEEIQRVQDEETTEIEAVGSTRVIFNGMRSDVEPFSDPQFRRALNYAVDADTVVEDVLQGFGDPVGQPTLPGYVGHNEDVDLYPHEPELAEQLIEDAGHDGVEIELDTPVGRYLGDLDTATALAGQIDDLDVVDASVNQREFADLAGEVTDGDIETNPDWYLLGWGNATFDASQTLIPLLTSDGATSAYRNEEFDALIEQAQSMED